MGDATSLSVRLGCGLRYIEYRFSNKETPFPNTYRTIQALCEAVLKSFSAASLRLCVQGEISTAGKPRPVEAQYQDEFYRSFRDIMPSGVTISSEWSPRGNGRLDLWIPQKNGELSYLGNMTDWPNTASDSRKADVTIHGLRMVHWKTGLLLIVQHRRHWKVYS